MKESRAGLDQYGDFHNLTESQFNQVVSILENLYKKPPERFIVTLKNLITRRTTLTKLSKIEDQREKDIRRINLIAGIGDESGTYFAIKIALGSCLDAVDLPHALQIFHQNISNYQDANRVRHVGKQNKIGILAVRVCMHQKQNYW